jgi:predicted secreted Zn-dependent protease
MRRLWFTGLLAAVMCPMPGMAEPLTRMHTSYYYVGGSSASVLAAQIDQSGPQDADGKHHPGMTRWDVQWKFNHKQEGETCGVKDVLVAVGITRTLPKWRDEEKGGRALKARWKKFAEALARYLDGHKEHGLKAGAEIEKVLLAIQPASNCEDLDKAANAAGERVVGKYRKLGSDYDRDTDYGRKQGATLL